MRYAGILIVALAALAGGCVESEAAIGRRCSDADECPVGQACSDDGQCLERCPEPDCEGAGCGCTGRLVPWEDSGAESSCRADGLCHFTCEEQGCPEGMRCVTGNCHAGCPDGWCPEGRTCEDASTPDQAYCHG